MSKQDTFAKGFKGENDKPVDDVTLFKVSKAGEQQTDPTTGRVIPTPEAVERDIENMLYNPKNYKPGLLDKTLVKVLTTYVMQQKNDDYYRGVNLGLSIGRKEMVAAMEMVTDEDIKQMVNRFLNWKLPEDFNPDAGISFKKPDSPAPHWWPVGTNLFTATQAEAMIRYITEQSKADTKGTDLGLDGSDATKGSGEPQ